MVTPFGEDARFIVSAVRISTWMYYCRGYTDAKERRTYWGSRDRNLDFDALSGTPNRLKRNELKLIALRAKVSNVSNKLTPLPTADCSRPTNP